MTKKQHGIEEYAFVTTCNICNEKSLIQPFYFLIAMRGLIMCLCHKTSLLLKHSWTINSSIVNFFIRFSFAETYTHLNRWCCLSSFPDLMIIIKLKNEIQIIFSRLNVNRENKQCLLFLPLLTHQRCFSAASITILGSTCLCTNTFDKMAEISF